MPAQSSKNNIASIQGLERHLFLSRRSLVWQIMFITILPLTLLVLVITFGSLTVHQNAMRMLVSERDERAVRTAAAALEEQVKHRVLAIYGLAALAEAASSENLDPILASSDYLLPEFDIGLAFFAQDGSLKNNVGDQEMWETLASQISPIIPDFLAQRDTSPSMSSAFVYQVGGEPIVVALAVSPTRGQVAAGAFSAAEMVQHTITNAFASGADASVIILDANRRLLYQSGTFSYPGQVSDHPGVMEALRGETGTTYTQVGKSEHVVAYSPIASLGWALVLEEPWEMVATPTLRASQMAPLVLVPVLILAVVALWFGARRIVKPLQALEAKAATLAGGNFETIEEPVGGIEEIRHLQTELIHMARKVQAAQQSLHSYIGAITAAQEDERRRLARELHDDTIQALIALKQRLQLARLASQPAVPASTAPQFTYESAGGQEIASFIEQTIENLRRLTRALRPIYLEDLGLVTALEMLARETGQAAHIAVEFQRQGIERRLDPAVELALYRMTQEALSNITRHAQAAHASLKIAFTAQAVTLQVTDDGQGFMAPKSPAEFAPGGHYGLLGLHERAELIHAALEICSAPGQGTKLNITLPVATR